MLPEFEINLKKLSVTYNDIANKNYLIRKRVGLEVRESRPSPRRPFETFAISLGSPELIAMFYNI